MLASDAASGGKENALSAIELTEAVAKPADDDGSSLATINVAQNLNIGGGVRFKHAGWINLDEFPGDGMAPFTLSELRPFPLPRAMFQIVYSSHCLEHLPEAAVSNCLHEARRVIQAGGTLVIKLPDYEATLRACRAGDHEFFSNRWGLERIAPLWQNRGVPDCIESRASMVFCGFWNKAYGHEFAGNPPPESPARKPFRQVLGALFRPKGILPDSGKPYHGPAPILPADVRRILAQESPRKIARDLRGIVASRETDFTFNHQAAFSAFEFIELLEEAGFQVEDTDGRRVVANYPAIPGIEEQFDISSYFVCRPR